MKKFILYILICLSFGCKECETPTSTVVENKDDYVYKWDNPLDIRTIDGAMSWCADSVTYRSDTEIWGRSEYWQTPQETYNKRTGDCEDYAIMFMQLVHELGYKPELISITQYGSGHTIVKLNDLYYNVQVKKVYTRIEDVKGYENVREKYSYGETMWYTVKEHRGRK